MIQMCANSPIVTVVLLDKEVPVKVRSVFSDLTTFDGDTVDICGVEAVSYM